MVLCYCISLEALECIVVFRATKTYLTSVLPPHDHLSHSARLAA